MKSYIDQSIRPFLEKPNKKKFKKLESMVHNFKEGWPDDLWEPFTKEYLQTLERYKELQPSKWNKWGKFLMKLISII
ncbi:hypothetical protein LCGC14_2161580 [marine sediment metagenome]|uniref:Uncharacterized protein n=1 Tax=marine sediment metagenome TaxID=412755 RepID=A0A0F9EEX9_9ZZZZ